MLYTFGFGGGSSRNRPIDLPSTRPDKRPMTSATGNAGRDGYTALSTADRETGIRPPVGGTPVRPALRTDQD
jgi:hypothetical protein